MPWDVGDVDGFKKGLTDAQKRQWVEVANSALAACLKDGGTDCEASAIRQANGVVEESMHEHVGLGEKIIEAILADATAKAKLSKALGSTPAASEAAGMPSRFTETRFNEISLRPGQSLSDFERSLRAAVRKQANPSNDRDKYSWISDVYESRLVYQIENGPESEKYYEVEYTMKDDGSVELSDPVEVIREISYRPAIREAFAESGEIVAEFAEDGALVTMEG